MRKALKIFPCMVLTGFQRKRWIVRTLVLTHVFTVWGCGTQDKGAALQRDGISKPKSAAKPSAGPGIGSPSENASKPLDGDRKAEDLLESRWTLVPQQSFVGIVARKSDTKHYAKFSNVTGHLIAQGDTWKSMNVYVETDSFEADVPAFAEHVRSPDFLDSKAFPKAEFASSSIVLQGDAKSNEYLLGGVLTLRGAKQELSFPIHISRRGRHVELEGEITLDLKQLRMSASKLSNELIEGADMNVRLTFVTGAKP